MQFKTLQRLASFESWRGPANTKICLSLFATKKRGSFCFGWRQQNSKGAKAESANWFHHIHERKSISSGAEYVTLQQKYLSHPSFNYFTFFQPQPMMKRKTAIQQETSNSNPPGPIKPSTQSETWREQSINTDMTKFPGLLQGALKAVHFPQGQSNLPLDPLDLTGVPLSSNICIIGELVKHLVATRVSR